MNEAKPLTRRATLLLRRLAPPNVLCAESATTRDDVKRGGLVFWIEPSGGSVGPASARELIDAGAVVPSDDALIEGASQTWRAAR